MAKLARVFMMLEHIHLASAISVVKKPRYNLISQKRQLYFINPAWENL
jgi:hypothetical protein